MTHEQLIEYITKKSFMPFIVVYFPLSVFSSAWRELSTSWYPSFISYYNKNFQRATFGEHEAVVSSGYLNDNAKLTFYNAKNGDSMIFTIVSENFLYVITWSQYDK